MDNSTRRQMSLTGLSLAIGALVFAIPSPAKAQGCQTSECTYYGSEGSQVGHCGTWDTSCGCFANVGGGGQKQSACNS
jgi:hypothetical protein